MFFTGNQLRMPAALVAALLFVAYAPSLTNKFVYDDRHLILENPLVQDAGHLLAVFGEEFFRGLGYYRPLALVSFVLDYRIWGLNPFGFHLTNILLLAATGAILFLVLSKFLGPNRVRLALFATLLFCLHPVASSVTYAIGARADLLVLPMLLLALLFYLRMGAVSYVLSVVFFSLALLSKETAVTFPIVVLALELLGLGRRGHSALTAGEVLRQALFWVVLFAYLAVRSFVLGETVGELTFNGELVLQSYAYCLQTLFVPTVALLYEPLFGDWFSALRLSAAGLVLAAIAFAAVRGSGTGAKKALFWLAWAVITFLPTSNIVQQETLWDERYTALPAIGIIVFSSIVIWSLKWSRLMPAPARLIAALVPLTVCLVITLGRSGYWRDDLTFFTQWRSTSPSNPRPHNNLGIAYREMGDLERAMKSFRLGIAADSSYARNYNNLGLAHAQLGEYDKAIPLYIRATEIDADYGLAFYNLASAYSSVGGLDLALDNYRRALEIHPGWVTAMFQAGRVCSRAGRLDEAADYYRRTIAANPEFGGAYFEMSIVFERKGLMKEAMSVMREGLKHSPNDAMAQRRLRMLQEVATGESDP
jgi:tetratricopeptide (TPR) repeat protein